MAQSMLFLVCAPADAPLTVAGATFNRKCSRCGVNVMVAPTGEARLKEHPKIQIVCVFCFVLEDMPEPSFYTSAKTNTEFQQEISNIVPNMRR